MKTTTTRLTIVTVILTSMLTGCEDGRVAQVAREAADRQAQQNTEMAELQKEVVTGTKSLVDADSKARQETLAVQHDIQTERDRLFTGWGDLERERQKVVSAQRIESLLVPILEAGGPLVLVIVLLGFCWQALAGRRQADSADAELNEILVAEIVSETPALLPSHATRHSVTNDPDACGKH